MMLHQQMHDFHQMLLEAAESCGFHHSEWAIVCRKSGLDSGLWFSCVGTVYLARGLCKHVIHGGPDMATAIQGVQGKLRELQQELAGNLNKEASK